MTYRRKIEVDRFLAKSDKGKEYIIIKYQDYISERNIYGEVFEIEDLLDFRTTSGLQVISIDSKSKMFEITETKEIVQKV